MQRLYHGITKRKGKVLYAYDPVSRKFWAFVLGKYGLHFCRSCKVIATRRNSKVTKKSCKISCPQWKYDGKKLTPDPWKSHFDGCAPFDENQMRHEQRGNEKFCVENVALMDDEELRIQQTDEEIEIVGPENLDSIADGHDGNEQMNNAVIMDDVRNAESDRFADFDDVSDNCEIVANGVRPAVHLDVEMLEDDFEGGNDRFFDALESFEEAIVGDYMVNVEAVFGAEDFDMDPSGLNPGEFGGHSSPLGSRENSVELGDVEERNVNGAAQVREPDFEDAVDHIDAERFAVRADSGDDDEDYFVIDPRFYEAATPVQSNNGSLIHHAINDRMMNIPSPIASPNLSGVASAHASQNISNAAPAHLSTQVSIAGTSASTVSNDVLILGQPASPAAPPADNDDEDSDHDPNEDFDWSRWTF